MRPLSIVAFCFLVTSFGEKSAAAEKSVSSATELIAALSGAQAGDAITMVEGRFEIAAPLLIRSGISLRGAGTGKTILTHETGWKAATATLPDPETDWKKFDRSGYLIQLEDKAAGVTISDLTLTGPQLHGAIFGFGNDGFEARDLRIEGFMYSGIRSYQMKGAKIHGCTFVDAGQRWERGQPGLKGGITGGGIFCIWISDSEIWNNRFLRTKTAPNEHYYGIKGRQGKRLRIHHNTIETNFSIEFPFENDEDVEIAHNICHGTVSIPKHAGGPVPASGRTFHIHHNLFRDTYSIEFVRNGVEIDHNLFDFDAEKDHGNLISGFGNAPAAGPASFHHNLVSNPGRGVIWINEPFSRLAVYNNHIVCRPTRTPRQDGLFGFHAECDFKTFRFENNIIECADLARPLFRNDASAASRVANNRLTNVSDAARYANQASQEPAGPGEPLVFRCGVNGEVLVEDWKSRKAPAE